MLLGKVFIFEFDGANSPVCVPFASLSGFIPFITTQASGHEILRANQFSGMRDSGDVSPLKV